MSTLTPLPVRTITRFLRRAALVLGLAFVGVPSALLAYTFNSATDVPVTATSYSASGTISLSLNFTPVAGTNLTAINNTGLGFISGKFSNLAQGQSMVLSYGGVNYSFVANYYGGTGNDLVLQWANVRALAWGDNSYGQLGNNSTTQSNVPTAVLSSGVLSGKTVVALAAGVTHSLALCSDGTVAAWGNNASGQLGNNSTTQSQVPVAVNVDSGTSALSGKTVVAVAVGGGHSLALCSDGTVAAWGDNTYGQLGNNNTADSHVPVAVNVVSGTSALYGKTVVALAAGSGHSLALCSDGTVVAWGINADGELGNNSTSDSHVPVAVDTSGALYSKTVVALVAGGFHSLVLCSDGMVAAWGNNYSGELGNNSVTDSLVPVAVNVASALYGRAVVTVAAGLTHSLALCSDGTVAAWGGNTYGELGNNSTTQSNVPVAVNTSALASGERFALVANGQSAYHALALVAAPPPTPVVTLSTANLLVNATTLIINGTNFDATRPGNNTVVFSPTGTGTVTASTATSLTVTGISGLTVGELNAVVTTNIASSGAAVQVATVILNGLTYTFTTATGVGVTSFNYAATGPATLSLGYAPVAGTNLTAINNTGLGFISGRYSNLAHGQAIVLSYGGVNYSFVANYYGGTGNDLVLQWANVRPLAWGYNSSGQLGNNSTTQSKVPAAVLNSGVLAGKTVVALAAGSSHSLALCSDGTLAAWGSNGNGQLGNNSTTSSQVPVAVNVASGTSVLYGKTVVAVTAGQTHSLALCSDGTVAAWGLNSSGQLGNNSTTQSQVPVAVNMASGTSALYGKTVVALAAGVTHSLALCSDGTVAAWGLNSNGELGNNSTTQSLVPVAVNVTSGTSALYGKTAVAVAAGANHSLALCSDGTVAAWGDNTYGQLGNNNTADSQVPVAVNVVSGTSALYGKTVAALAAGANHSLALCSDGTVAAWGHNNQGELGNNSTADSLVPVAVNVASGTSALYGKTVVDVTAGQTHSLALCNDGTVAAWGFNFYGQLGNNSTTQSKVPVAVNTSALASGERFSLVASGQSAYHALALVAAPPPPTVTLNTASLAVNATTLTINGTSFDATTPGNNTVVFSPSGTGTVTASTATSLTVTGISGLTLGALNAVVTTNTASSGAAVQVATVIPYGLTYTFTTATGVGVTSSGYAVTGPATLSLGYAPVAGANLTAINNTGLGFISGTYSNLAQGQAVVLNYGGVDYSFVANYYGGTGNDLVLQWANARPLAWGYNSSGQLGNNSTTQSNVPAAVLNSGVLAGKTVVALAAGSSHSLALCSDGTLAAWGDNTYGQLGNNGTVSSEVPAAVLNSGVLSGKTVVALAAGAIHSLALCSDGTVAAWGSNSNGQLGNNSTNDSQVPVAVNVASGTSALYGKTVVALAAGIFHSLALCSDGTVAAWGFNGNGELGNNSVTDSQVPVAVNVASGTSVLYGKTVVALAVGASHGLALCSDGTVAAWGSNGNGQLGNNSTNSSQVPVAVNVASGTSALYGRTVVAVAAGSGHSLALCSDGTAVAWGNNSDGELGNNSTTQSQVPVAVNVVSGTSALYGKTVVALAAGSVHSLALCNDGTTAVWGYNADGELGNNSTAQSQVPVAVNTSALASGERFSLVASGPSADHTLALVAALPAPEIVPEIAIEQPVGTGLTDGSSTISFGVMAAGSSTTAKTFTIKNLGGSDLTGIVITTDGTNAGDYTVNTTGMTTSVVSNASTTFTVTFTPTAASVSGTRTAALHIASNDPNQNPFDIALGGTGLSQTYDTDADGLNDAAEFQLASLGFDWQTAQPALVATLTTNANTANLFTSIQVAASRQSGRDDVTCSPNTYSLYTQSQFQALSVGVPLLQMNGATGQFKLTIGVQKSTDLMHFDAFPLTAPQTTVNAQGQLEFQFTVPDGAAFFRLQSQ